MTATPNKTLITYIKNRSGHHIGVVVAVGRNQVGWSLCNHKDKFSKERALAMALGRACEGSKTPVPPSAAKAVAQMTHRSERYFKATL